METARLSDQGQDVIFLTVGDPDPGGAGAGHNLVGEQTYEQTCNRGHDQDGIGEEG